MVEKTSSLHMLDMMTESNRSSYLKNLLIGLKILDLEVNEVKVVNIGAQRAQEVLGGPTQRHNIFRGDLHSESVGKRRVLMLIHKYRCSFASINAHPMQFVKANGSVFKTELRDAETWREHYR